MSCKLHNIRFYKLEPKAIYCMAIQYETNILALSRSDAHIELWNIKDIPVLVRTIPGTPNGSVEALCWVGTRLFSTGLSGAVVEWDIKTLSPKTSIIVTGQAAWCIDVTKSLKKLAVGTEQGYLNLYSVDNHAIDFIRIFDKQEGRILCCKFDPSGSVLVTGSIETVRIWNVNTGQALHRMNTGRLEKNKETIVWCLAVTADLTVISGDSRGRLTFWDGNIGEQLESVTTHKCDILSVCLDENESTVYCAGVDPLIVTMERVKIKHKNEQGHVDKWVKSIKRNIHSHDVRGMLMYRNKLFSAGVDSFLAVSSYPPKMLVKYPPVNYPVARFCAKPKIVCLRYSNYLEIWKLGSAKSDEDGGNYSYMVDEDATANSNSSHSLVIGDLENGDARESMGGKIKRLQLSEGPSKLIKIGTSSSATMTCCDISPDAHWVSYSTDAVVRIFQLKMDENEPVLSKLTNMPEECTPCYKMSFTPDSAGFITATADLVLKLFKLDGSNGISHLHTIFANQVLKEMSLVHMYVSDIINRGYYIAVGDMGGNVAVWRTSCKGNETPTLVTRLPKYTSVSTAMAIDNSLNLIVTYSDQKILEYSLKHNKLTEFNSQLQSNEYGLGPKWSSRQYQITSVHFHPTKNNLILLNDDIGAYVINKNTEMKGVSPKKPKLQNGDFQSKIKYTTIKKTKHIVATHWLSDDEAAIVIVEPESMSEKLPPCFVKERFGTM